MGERRAEMQASELRAQGLPLQSTTPSRPIPLTDSRNTSSSFLSISSILDGPASAPSSSEQNLSGAIPATEGCPATFFQFSRSILIPKLPSPATRIQRAANERDIIANFPISPESSQTYTANQRPLVSPEVRQLPTPPAQSHGQCYESISTSRPITDHWHSNEGSTKASAKILLLQSGSPSILASLHDPSSCQTSPTSLLDGKIGQPLQTSTLHNPGDSFVRTAQEGGVVSSQATPETSGGSYNAFSFSSTCSLGQTSPLDPDSVLTLVTSQGSYQVPVDVHIASWEADEKRARNAGASARFRLRRKEREILAEKKIAELEERIKELERDRDFYRGERDRFRDIVLKTPGLKHHDGGEPSSPQSMRSASSHRIIPKGAHPQATLSTEFHATDPTSGRAPKRRRTGTQHRYPSTEALPPKMVHTPVLAGFPPTLNHPPQNSTPSVCLPMTTIRLQSDAPYVLEPFEQGWPNGRVQQQPLHSFIRSS